MYWAQTRTGFASRPDRSIDFDCTFARTTNLKLGRWTENSAVQLL